MRLSKEFGEKNHNTFVVVKNLQFPSENSPSDLYSKGLK